MPTGDAHLAERRVVVLTGAGISADSGVRTYRGSDGLWEGFRLEDVATPQAWRRDPRTVWRFYQQRRAQLASVLPNAAHRALTAAQRGVRAAGGTLLLVSQNVDDLHARAGADVLSMHGQLADLACEACGVVVRDLARLDPERFAACAGCGHEPLRPDVCWFGEVPSGLDTIERALTECTDFVAVGTSGVVWPAAGMLLAAREFGARTFVQALEEPENLDPRDTFVRGRASEVVPRLLADVLAPTT